MKEITQIAIDYLQGKEVYPQIRRLLSQIFLLCLSSHFYTKYCGKYEWYSITDYKKIIDFVIQGHFIVPFCIYLIVFFAIRSIELIIFYYASHYKGNKLHRSVNEANFSQVEIRYILNAVYKASKQVVPINITKELLVSVVKENSSEIKSVIDSISKNSNIVKSKFEVNFNLLFRAFFTLIILYGEIPNLNIILLSSCLLILFLSMLFLIKAFHIYEVAPSFLTKIYEGVLIHDTIPYKQTENIQITNSH